MGKINKNRKTQTGSPVFSLRRVPPPTGKTFNAFSLQSFNGYLKAG